jgi:hypothetical protein
MQGIKALRGRYESDREADKEIKKRITGYYRANHEELYENNSEIVNQAVTTLQNIWKRNVHNGVDITWGLYADHSRHGKQEGGCFRCHNQRMRSTAGKLIPQDCTLCHDVIADGEKDPAFIKIMNESMFRHSSRPQRGLTGESAEK